MTGSRSSSRILGLTYWPQRAGYRWWEAFDRGAVREELQHVASLGCNSVRLCLSWEALQPGPRRAGSATLRVFEQALDLAGEAGLRVVAALFPVALGGALHIPRWVSHPDPLGELQQVARFGVPLVVQGSNAPPLVYEGGYHANDAPDMFRDAALQDAERYVIHEVVGYFGAHPALWGWQLGEGLELVRRPDSAAAVHEWYGRMAEAVRAERNGAPVLGVTTGRGLLSAAGPRPEHLADTCDLVGVALDTPLPLPELRPNDARWAVFAHALASALAGRPVAVAGLGLPTAPDGQTGWHADSSYGRAIQTYYAHSEEQAEFVGTAFEQLHAAGAPAIWLSDYADYSADTWRTPPLDRQARGRTLGLVDADGREKPVAEVVRAFSAKIQGSEGGDQESGGRERGSEIKGREPGDGNQERGVANNQRAPEWTPALDVDPERYWRDPRRECERLWREFIS